MKKYLLIIFPTLILLSCDLLTDFNSTYIYEGRYSAEVLYRVGR